MIARNSYKEKIQSAFNLVPIVGLIGARQVGKTSIMKAYPTESFRNALFLNGQDVEVAARFQQFSTIEQYLKIYLNEELNGLLLLDEFQFIQGISTMLKLLTDKYDNLRILCSGSSSLDILQHIEESLAGRVRVIEVLSLSFSEYLLFKDEKLWRLQQELQGGSDEALVAPLRMACEEYLIYGGLPRTALTNNPQEKVELLNDIYQTYLLNDVRHYIANEHFVGFNKLLRLLAVQIGNLVNVNDLSRESGLPYARCEEYIYLLQKMYIIKLVEPYFTNKRKVIGKMNKVYFCDLGLRNIIYNSFNEIAFRTDNGALFENYILLELWRKRQAADTIYFYRTQSGTEVDFVLDGSLQKLAVECKYRRFQNPVSIPSLNNFADEENINFRYIANINMDTEYKGVRLIPGILANRIGT
ncbi:MAG: ATP-binding protein [Bacteroides sp.]|jgi:predicted AAA+ superfamily ATPase|nr:ATP-binding protein [Bacteroides sp.]